MQRYLSSVKLFMRLLDVVRTYH